MSDKVTYRSADGRMTVEFDVKEQKGLFAGLARFQEVFEDSTQCGCCGCKFIKFVVRNVDDNDFYELHCRNLKCLARKSFGVNKTGGTLFPHRKDKEGKYLPNNGWAVWDGRKKEPAQEEAQPEPAPGKKPGGKK